MSEADTPNRENGLSESAESVDVTVPSVDSQASEPVAEEAPDEGWETVDFPGAMSVDAIPREGRPIEVALDVDPEVISALASLSEASLAEANSEMEHSPEAVETVAKPKLVVISSGAAAPEQDNFARLMQQLQQENTELRDRIVQLEQDLTQQQIEFQLEVARSLSTNAIENAQFEGAQLEVPNPQAVKELAAAQERISQLFKELELSQQTAQRQQILVETISEQLESSQERIAQLERDCALAQQRYNEQVQQLLQAENTCRDLRMRLHRQQRHTLQFKAALEKCLEMPAPYRQNHFMPDLRPEPDATTPNASIGASSSQAFTPKNQPVRPWSVSSTQDADDPDLADTLPVLPRSLSRLVNPDLNESDLAESGSLPWASSDAENPQATADWMNLIFADTPDSQTYSAIEPQPSSPIFDLSPFLESENADSQSLASDVSKDAATPQPNPVLRDESLLQMLAAVPLDSDELGSPLGAFQWGQSTHSEETLWDDLAKLIDPPASSEPATAKAKDIKPEDTKAEDASVSGVSSGSLELPQSDVPSTETATISQITPFPISGSTSKEESPEKGEVPRTEAVSNTKKAPELTSWQSRSSKPPAQNTRLRPATPQTSTKDTPTPVAASKSAATGVAQKADGATSPSLSGDPFSGSWPSPVVYPLRPSKKLKSLAAVELPSFPRAT
jgi:hypothetical protein